MSARSGRPQACGACGAAGHKRGTCPSLSPRERKRHVRGYSYGTHVGFIEALRHVLGLDPLHEGRPPLTVERFGGRTYPDVP
jgi:hypothetical protein